MYNNTNEIHLQHHTLFVEERLICQFLYKSIQIIVVLKKNPNISIYMSSQFLEESKNQKSNKSPSQKIKSKIEKPITKIHTDR